MKVSWDDYSQHMEKKTKMFHMIRLWFVQAFPESRYFVAMKHVEISLFVAAYITLYPYLHVINPS